MKKIATYTILLAALGSAACSRTDDFDIPQHRGSELVVNAELVSASDWKTRGGASSASEGVEYGAATQSTDGQYLVSATRQEWTGESESDAADVPLTRGTPITSVAGIANIRVNVFQTGTSDWTTSSTRTSAIMATKSGSGYTTSPTYNWLADATTKTSLFAYSPLTSSSNGLSENGTNKINYTVPTTVANQPDFCTAPPKMNIINSDGTKQIQTFALNHQLTAVGFSMLGWNLKITKITVSGVAVTGTLTMNADGSTSWATSTTGSRDVGVTQSSYTHNHNSSYADITTSNGYLMMIPQTLSDAATVTITYASTGTGSEGGTITAKLKDIFATWAAGEKITYNIRLKTAPAVTSGDMTITDYRAGYTTSAPLSFVVDPKDNLTFTWSASWLKIHRGSPKAGDTNGGAVSPWSTDASNIGSNIYFFTTNDNASSTSERTAVITVKGKRSGTKTFNVKQKGFVFTLSSPVIELPAPRYGTAEITYTISNSAITPVVTNLPSWCSHSVNTSTKKITFTTTVPNWGAARTQELTIKGGLMSQKVHITQDATIPFKSTGYNSVQFNNKGGTWGSRVRYQGVDAPTITRTDSWVGAKVTRPDAQGAGTISISAPSYTGTETRTATVTVSLNGSSFKVTVVQLPYN